MTDISIALWVLSNCFRRGGGGGALGRQAAASFAALAWLVAINLHSLRHVVCLAAVKRSGVILRRMIVFVARQSAATAAAAGRTSGCKWKLIVAALPSLHARCCS